MDIQRCAKGGSVAVCELVQVAEDYVLEHNKDPTVWNVSAWEQMKAREKKEEEEEVERRRKSEEEMEDELEGEDSKGSVIVGVVGDGEVERELSRQRR